MGYHKKTAVISPDEIEITKFYGGMVGNHSKRKSREQCARTCKAVEKHNYKMTVKKLYDLLRMNFDAGDWHLALTYKQGTMSDIGAAEHEVSNFLQRLRRYCKKAGVTLKYIWNTDVGKRGGIHHHIILPKEIPYAEIQRMWTGGMVKVNSILWRNKDFYGLAQYLVDPTKQGTLPDIHRKGARRYKPSNNLLRPKVEYEYIQADSWLKDPRAPKGWQVKKDSVFNSVDEYTGYPYQVYTIVPIARRI